MRSRGDGTELHISAVSHFDLDTNLHTVFKTRVLVAQYLKHQTLALDEQRQSVEDTAPEMMESLNMLCIEPLAIQSPALAYIRPEHFYPSLHEDRKIPVWGEQRGLTGEMIRAGMLDRRADAGHQRDPNHFKYNEKST